MSTRNAGRVSLTPKWVKVFRLAPAMVTSYMRVAGGAAIRGICQWPICRQSILDLRQWKLHSVEFVHA